MIAVDFALKIAAFPLWPKFLSEGTIPKGTQGTVVERYESPKEGYAVDLEVPDDSLTVGLRYESVVLLPEQFGIVR